MADYKVVAKIVKTQGECTANHKVGEVFEFGNTAPAGLCLFAFGALYPTVNMLLHGGQYPWDKPGVSYWGCPDTKNLVTFQLERVPVAGDA